MAWRVPISCGKSRRSCLGETRFDELCSGGFGMVRSGRVRRGWSWRSRCVKLR